MDDFNNNAPAPTSEQLAERAQRFTQFRNVPHERLAVLPKGAAPDQQLAVLQRLGAPNDAKAYDFSKTAIPKEMHGWAAETAAKAGLLPHQAMHVAEKFAGSFDPEAEAKAAQESADAEMSALQDEWKGDYLQKMELGRRAMRHAERAGHNAAEVLSYLESAIGVAATLKVAHEWGRTIVESDFIDGDTTPAPAGGMLSRMYPNG